VHEQACKLPALASVDSVVREWESPDTGEGQAPDLLWLFGPRPSSELAFHRLRLGPPLQLQCFPGLLRAVVLFTKMLKAIATLLYTMGSHAPAKAA
jgi:hypothetical protein